MKNRLFLLIIFSLLGFKTYSQINFEKGYFIEESNQQKDVLIRNMDWRNNPTSFEYKISEDSAVQTAKIEDIKEFGISNHSKYIRATVEIDKSGDDLGNLTANRNPEFQEETMFLEVLVEGDATLYRYRNGGLTRYFYNVNDAPIRQLIYKSYLVDNNKIVENKDFRQQVSTQLSCEGMKALDLVNLEYSRSDLKRVFVNYNQCVNSGYTAYGQGQNRDIVNLFVRPGVNFSSLSVTNEKDPAKNTDFGDKINYRLGLELEFVLPYNRNKWGIIVEPTYHYFKAKKTKETEKIFGGTLEAEVDYQSIELPVGVRHYFFLNENSKIFADISYNFEFSGNSEITMSWYNGTLQDNLEIKSKPNLAFGLGYKYSNYSISARYQMNRQLLDYVFWDAKYETFSLILGYSIL